MSARTPASRCVSDNVSKTVWNLSQAVYIASKYLEHGNLKDMHKSRCPRVTKQVTRPMSKFLPVTRPHFSADRKGRCVRRKGKIINQDIILEKKQRLWLCPCTGWNYWTTLNTTYSPARSNDSRDIPSGRFRRIYAILFGETQFHFYAK